MAARGGEGRGEDLTQPCHRVIKSIQEGRDLAFYCKPYLLKLHFPHTLRGSEEEEGSHCRAVYDADLVRREMGRDEGIFGRLGCLD